MSLEKEEEEYNSDDEDKKTLKRLSYKVSIDGNPLTVLIDSGSECNYISATTAIRLQLPAYKKKKPYRLQHAEGQNFQYNDG
jgi:hypothetical protein